MEFLLLRLWLHPRPTLKVGWLRQQSNDPKLPMYMRNPRGSLPAHMASLNATEKASLQQAKVSWLNITSQNIPPWWHHLMSQPKARCAQPGDLGLSPRARHCCAAKCSELGHRTIVLAKLQRCYNIAQNLESIMSGYKSALHLIMVSPGEHCLASLSLNPLICRMDLMITPHNCDLIFIKFQHSGYHTVCSVLLEQLWFRRTETEILPLSITLTTVWCRKSYH